MKRALLVVVGVIVLLAMVPAVVRHWRAAPVGTPEYSLQQLAMAARLGMWTVADVYVDREALRREMARAAYELWAEEYPAPNYPDGTWLIPWEEWRQGNSGKISGPIDEFIVELCKVVDAPGATVVRSGDGQWAEVTFPPARGMVFRLKMQHVDGRRWRLVGVPSWKENMGPGFRGARAAAIAKE